MPGRLPDPARQEARVLALERPRELLDAAAVLPQAVEQRLAVVEEDVDPDPRVGAGDAGHVAERPADGAQRVVAVHAARAGLVCEDVRDGVRQVARDRHEPVVRAGVDRDRPRAEAGDEPVHRAVVGRVGGRGRREEPRRALEEVGARVLRRREPPTRTPDGRPRSAGSTRRPTPAATSSSRRPSRRSPRRVAATVCSTSAGRWTTGPHTTATSAPATAPSSVSSTRAAAPRSRPAARASGSGSNATTSSPRAAAASPIDPPMRPSPTIAEAHRATPPARRCRAPPA